MAKTHATTATTKRVRKTSGTTRTAKTARAAGTTVSGTKKKAAARVAQAPKLPKLPKAIAATLKAASDKQATNVVLLDLRKTDGFTDFFVICTGGSQRQLVAIADHVRDTLKGELDERPLLEGSDKSEWILLDYFNFVVHVFSRECRAFYDLERLWGNAIRHVID